MRLMMRFLILIVTGCTASPVASPAATTLEIKPGVVALALHPAAGARQLEAASNFPFYDGYAWSLGDSPIPVRYPVAGLQVGDVIIGYRLHLERIAIGPATSTELEVLRGATGALETTGYAVDNEARLGIRVLEAEGFEKTIGENDAAAIVVQGGGVLGDRALNATVWVQRAEPAVACAAPQTVEHAIGAYLAAWCPWHLEPGFDLETCLAFTLSNWCPNGYACSKMLCDDSALAQHQACVAAVAGDGNSPQGCLDFYDSLRA
jgi:hypothetical protein